MQLSHVTAFWLRLAGNILLDLSLYVHLFCPQPRARDYTASNPFEPLPFAVTPDIRGLGALDREGAPAGGQAFSEDLPWVARGAAFSEGCWFRVPDPSRFVGRVGVFGPVVRPRL